MLVLGQQAALGAFKIRATLAVTKRHVEGVNDSLDRLIPRDTWIVTGICDWRDQNPQQWPRRDIRASNIAGYARE